MSGPKWIKLKRLDERIDKWHALIYESKVESSVVCEYCLTRFVFTVPMIIKIFFR